MIFLSRFQSATRSEGIKMRFPLLAVLVLLAGCEDCGGVGDTGDSRDWTYDTAGNCEPCPCWATACFDNDGEDGYEDDYGEPAWLAWDLDGGQDVDGDGVLDVVVAASGSVVDKSGRAYLFRGPFGGQRLTSGADAVFLIDGTQTIENVAILGDVTGDGSTDVATFNQGFDYINAEVTIFGPWNGDILRSEVDTVISGLDYAGFLRNYLQAAGDLDGNGVADLALSVSWDADDSRALLVYRGPLGGEIGVEDADSAFEPGGDEDPGMWIEFSAGQDLDGDGLTDLFVTEEDGYEGAAYLIPGPAVGWMPLEDAASASIVPDPPREHLRLDCPDAGGDVSGDGYADFIVAIGYEHNDAELAVFHGPLSGVVPGASADATVLSPGNLAFAGDVDDDGFDDIVGGDGSYGTVMDSYGYGGIIEDGRVWVLFGPLTGTVWADEIRGELETGGFMGDWLARAGDTDADGFSDLLLGAYGWHDYENDSGWGRAYLVSGEDVEREKILTR